MNDEPMLKRSALLRNIGQDISGGPSELDKLLSQPTTSNKQSKRKCDDITIASTSTCTSKMFKETYEDIVMPTTSTCSSLPIKVNFINYFEVYIVESKIKQIVL